MDGYEYEVFISYKRASNERSDGGSDWIREVVLPPLQEILTSTSYDDRMFVDEDIQKGARWPAVLRNKLTRSRVLVAFLSAAYFKSPWCRRELALMLKREEHEKIVGQGKNYGLVIPIWIADGDSFPTPVKPINCFDFNQFYLVCRSTDSKSYEELIQELKKVVNSICASLEKAPDWRSEWNHFEEKDYFNKLRPKRSFQRNNPRS